MKFQEIIDSAVVTTGEEEIATSVNIIHLYGTLRDPSNSAIKELWMNHPHADRIEITDVEWVVDRTPE